MTIYFPDISSGQAGISLTNAMAVTAKATEGTGYVNPDYAAAKGRAANSGTFFMAYHFLHQGNAAAQAAHAFSVVGNTVALMVDWETTTNSNPAVADAEGFIDAYRKLGGVTHLLYLPHWYWQQLGSPALAPFASRSMAIVSSDYTTYTDANSGPGWQPYGGMTPAIWQYTSTLQFNGYRCDFNAFRGTFAGKQDPPSITGCLSELRALATTGKYTAPTADGWTYDAPRALVASGGHTSVDLTWQPPAGAPVPPAEYLVYIYRGTLANTRTLVDSYPRRATSSPWQGGGLVQDQSYTAHVVASGPGGSHVHPFTYASAQFKTG